MPLEKNRKVFEMNNDSVIDAANVLSEVRLVARPIVTVRKVD